MRERDKQQQRQRYLKQLKKFRSHEEQKEIQAHSKARKQQRRSGKGRGEKDLDSFDEKSWDEQAPVDFEKIRRADRHRSRSKSASPKTLEIEAPEAGADLEFATVLETHPGLVKTFYRGGLITARVSHELSAPGELVVGDQVDIEKTGPGHYSVIARGRRSTLLSRPDPAVRGVRLVQAANVDTVGIVVSANRLKTGLIDRYLIAIEQGRAEHESCTPLIVANKVDLLDEDERVGLDEVLHDYRRLGVSHVSTSAKTGEGIKSLRAALQGKVSVFVGQSGVGKSSLLNRLAPEAAQQVNEVRKGDEKGRHTTTASRLVYADETTSLIDTPGIRAFGLGDLQAATLAEFFPDFPGGCRFRDCRHLDEPDCAVKRGAEEDPALARRYEFYQRLMESLRRGESSV